MRTHRLLSFQWWGAVTLFLLFLMYIPLDRVVAIHERAYSDLGIVAPGITKCLFMTFDVVRRWPSLFCAAMFAVMMFYCRFVARNSNRVKRFCAASWLAAIVFAFCLELVLLFPIRIR